MTLTRRSFLGSAAAALPLMSAPLAAAATPAPRLLRAAPATVQIAPEGYGATEVWAYNGTIPGETLRYRQGEELSVRFENGLDEETSVHWHGLRLPNAMDGVPGMTQPPVQPGAAFDYRFALPDAGTFWYHPHANSVEQVSRGLSGVLVVEEPEAPDVDRDLVVVLDDWRLTQEAAIHDSFGHRHDLSHAGRLGNYVTTNGTQEAVWTVRPGERLRLRLVNTATARVFELQLNGLRVWLAALDGMPLEEVIETTQLSLAPAQRVDLIVDVTEEAGSEAFLVSMERDGGFSAARFVVEGAPVTARPAPAPLPPNALPEIGAEPRPVELVMEGGAMRGLPPEVIWQGAQVEAMTAVEAGQFWTFNRHAGMPEAPLVDAFLGETIAIPITNKTAFPHAMHLHGMHFRERRADGSLGPWRDTILVNTGETREIVFVAENPGDWMFHCHMLSHQMSGMMNWIRVS